MTVITSREFNQNIGKAQKAALNAPVIITKRGNPTFVLMSYTEYERKITPVFKSALEALAPTDPDVADIEFELQPRSRGQRRPVEF